MRLILVGKSAGWVHADLFFFSPPAGEESSLFRFCISAGHLGAAIEAGLFEHVGSTAQRSMTRLGSFV